MVDFLFRTVSVPSLPAIEWPILDLSQSPGSWPKRLVGDLPLPHQAYLLPVKASSAKTYMVAKRAPRASSAAVHAGRPDSVRQRGRLLWCRPNWTRLRRGTSGTGVEVQMVSTRTKFVRTAAPAD